MIGIWIICVAVLGVHDGDTWTCRDTNGTEHSIRVHALHAPELRDPGGPEARDALAELLRHQWVTCLPLGRSFHRLVADCQVAGQRDLASAMIDSGTAAHCPAYGRDDLIGTPSNGIALPGYCE